MISVLNFKSFDKGAIKGFFDLRYHGLTIKGCRLMSGNNGLWFSFPQIKGETADGETQYFDMLFLSIPEREHIRRLILADLEAQSFIEQPKSSRESKPNTDFRPPGSEDLGEYYSDDQNDIPF